MYLNECCRIFSSRIGLNGVLNQDPSQSNVENLNKVRQDASRRLRNKKKAYMKARIEELETNSKIKM
jgi:hypothetical protein